MSHRMEDIAGMITALIIVYRNMQDTVQAQYALNYQEKKDLPLHAYYGEAWYSCMIKSLISCDQ